MISRPGQNKPKHSGNDNTIKVIFPFLHFYSLGSLLCFVPLSLRCCLNKPAFLVRGTLQRGGEGEKLAGFKDAKLKIDQMGTMKTI